MSLVPGSGLAVPSQSLASSALKHIGLTQMSLQCPLSSGSTRISSWAVLALMAWTQMVSSKTAPTFLKPPCYARQGQPPGDGNAGLEHHTPEKRLEPHKSHGWSAYIKWLRTAGIRVHGALCPESALKSACDVGVAGSGVEGLAEGAGGGGLATAHPAAGCRPRSPPSFKGRE